MAQVIEVYDSAGNLLGYIHQSEVTGGWRAVTLDGWIFHCTTRELAEEFLREVRQV